MRRARFLALAVLITTACCYLTPSVLAQVDCINEYTECSELVESEADTISILGPNGSPGDTVWLPVHFTLSQDSVAGFVCYVDYDATYLTPLMVPADSMAVQFQLNGALSDLQAAHPGDVIFYAMLSAEPFDSGAVVAAFNLAGPCEYCYLPALSEELFRLGFVINPAAPYAAQLDVGFQESNPYIEYDTSYWCLDCRRSELAVVEGEATSVVYPTLVPGTVNVACNDDVFVDHIDGSFWDGEVRKVQIGRSLTYFIRYTNRNSDCVAGTINAFRIWGPTSFEPLTCELLSIDSTFGYGLTVCDLYYDLVCQIDVYSDGIGADTVGHSGSEMMQCGFGEGFDELVYSFTTRVDDPAAVGQQICIDSCALNYPDPYGLGEWSWVTFGGSGPCPPQWNGPICLEIVPCCLGMRGNIDWDINDDINIADVVYLVTYMFNEGPAPPCAEEADVTADGEQDIEDLVYLVTYMFQQGPAPADCEG